MFSVPKTKKSGCGLCVCVCECHVQEESHLPRNKAEGKMSPKIKKKKAENVVKSTVTFNNGSEILQGSECEYVRVHTIPEPLSLNPDDKKGKTSGAIVS